jgi:ferrous iron transport protein B
LYFPCLAALAAVKKETGSWRWVALAVVYNTVLAWLLAWLTYLLAGIVM